MSIPIIIQARMSSSRLPGKMLRHMSGKPMLGQVVDSLIQCGLPVIVATSDDPSDDPLAAYCNTIKVKCCRGPLEDVASRYVLIAEKFGYNAFVRICGDSPLSDHRLVLKAVELFRKNSPDLVTNVHPRSFPKGQSVEVIRAETLSRAHPRMHSANHYEHVTSYIYQHAKDFRIENFTSGGQWENLQMSVDTQEDFDGIEGLISSLGKPHWEYSWKDLAQRLASIKGESC